MKTDELKKGRRVQMRNGWEGTMLDNAKGETRRVLVEGDHREAGTVYAHDIAYVMDTAGDWLLVEHTPEQDRLRQLAGQLGLGHA